MFVAEKVLNDHIQFKLIKAGVIPRSVARLLCKQANPRSSMASGILFCGELPLEEDQIVVN